VEVKEFETMSNYKTYNFKVLLLQTWSDKENEFESKLELQTMRREVGNLNEGKTN